MSDTHAQSAPRVGRSATSDDRRAAPALWCGRSSVAGATVQFPLPVRTLAAADTDRAVHAACSGRLLVRGAAESIECALWEGSSR